MVGQIDPQWIKIAQGIPLVWDRLEPCFNALTSSLLKLLEILWLIYGSATLGKALEGVVHKGVSLVVITSYVVYGIIALAVFVGFILFVVAICKYADRANAEPE